MRELFLISCNWIWEGLHQRSEMINHSEQLIFLLSWLRYQNLLSLFFFFIIIETGTMENFQSVPWWEAAGAAWHKNQCEPQELCSHSWCVVLWCENCPDWDCLPHAAEHREHKGSWTRWKVSQMKRKNKNKNKDKPASDALTETQNIYPWDLHFFIPLSNCGMVQWTRNCGIWVPWWNSSQGCMKTFSG